MGGLGLMWLVGCASQSGFSVPVEDRSSGTSRTSTAETITSAPTIIPEVISSAPQNKTPVISARSVPAGDTQQSAPVLVAPVVAPPLEANKYTGPSPVLLALMEQADGLESRGDQQGALAQLERAQRIAPRDPLVYLQLARLRLHMNDRVRAEQLARRGLSLANGDQDLVLAFEAILVELQR
jgi:hypothetical protein